MVPNIPVFSPDRAGDPRSLSPTDISQFIRLDQCQRFLRLRLHERANGQRFMRDYDVTPQAIPPILSKSGNRFEKAVESDISRVLPSVRFSEAQRRAAGSADNNADVTAAAASLIPGAVQVLFQPRLTATLDGWSIRGDVDAIRFERTADGALQPLIVDMKSSTSAKVEHRLQVAFYHEMLVRILADAGISHAPVEMAILYRGPAIRAEPADATKDDAQRAEALALFGTEEGLLERILDPAAYLDAVHDLVLGQRSTARRVVATPFDQVPFHLTYKCDGCLYNEFCMKQSAESDNLSLLPHLTEGDKNALLRGGIATVSELAALKDLQRKGQVTVDGETRENTELVPSPGKDEVARRLAATWPVGQRLDELIHRARRYRQWKKDEIDSLSYIPGKGYGSLPYSDAAQNPNLVRVYIDVQHDFLNDRVFMAGALVVGAEHGVERPERRRSVVRLAARSPESDEAEAQLLVEWVEATLQALAEVAAPDAEGKPRAPIHVIFINPFAQRVLLDALGRHATTILGATALYDFVTQIAAFDSPVSSFLDGQIRDHKNYPMLCQSLQAVAAFLKFQWNEGTAYRDLFRTGLFDFWGKLDDPPAALKDGWYTNRARFNSQIPLEYAYAAWNELPDAAPGTPDDFAPYRAVTPELLTGFHARRLEAMEHIAHDFAGNRQTVLTDFDLPDLTGFQQKAPTFAHALDEFVTIERHVELAAWKSARLAPPERRVLAGQTLIVRYLEADQESGVAERNRENERRRRLNEEYRAAWREEHPSAKQVRLPQEQRDETEWSQEDMVFRLRLETANLACDLDEALALSTIKEGDRLILCPRLTVDERRPAHEQVPFTPTVKQMLWGMRVDLRQITVTREHGRAVSAVAEIVMPRPTQGGAWSRGFVFGSTDRPLRPGDRYTLDADINNWNGYWAAKVTEGLVGGGENTLYAELSGGSRPAPAWPPESIAAQRRFLDGLDALHAAGALHDFEASKREFIGEHGATPLLLVQGPPGTGKSYSTAFALFARLQGAIAANREFRILLSCKTHAAIDVLLQNVLEVRDLLAGFSTSHPAIFDAHFDRRLLDVPLFRLRPRGDVADGIVPIPKDVERPSGAPKAIEAITSQPRAVVAGTPGAFYSLIKDRWPKALFGHTLAQCLVLDEASQMNLPEAAMAALPLAPDGTLIVVGDHRQMPPIVKNDWAAEPRRTFQEFRSYESLFLALLPLDPPVIRFAESFRLHAEMAEFLRKEIYHQDGIPYHSNRTALIERREIADDFVAAVLDPAHPLTVVVHDEARSQLHNRFEQELLAPVLQILADPAGYALDPVEGLGVVVPHRAQRAALQADVPALTRRDPVTGAIVLSAVDTVERFQGGERTVILIGATESDREYLLVSGKFLLDPRRLTVALSRAKRKMVLVAARSVFEVFSTDEETFANAQLWKNLLRGTCTVPLWRGARDGIGVEVWGNHRTTAPDQGEMSHSLGRHR